MSYPQITLVGDVLNVYIPPVGQLVQFIQVLFTSFLFDVHADSKRKQTSKQTTDAKKVNKKAQRSHAVINQGSTLSKHCYLAISQMKTERFGHVIF